MNKEVKNKIEELKDEFIELSNYIYENPELGFEEKKSSKAHVDILKKHGFEVEENYIGFETAFRGVYDSGKEGPTIGLLVEYDALPGIGHGCGHNILGTTSTGAGIVLSKFIDELGGKIHVLGSPAEETSGVKVDMANEGVFDDVDIAMMVHPNARHKESGSSLAITPIEFTFKGKTAHAASSPEKGINALDACIQTFNGINALREHVDSTSRIHGVITEGGEAANIVPDLAVAQFYVRTPLIGYIDELVEKVINCAKAGALATGAELEIDYFEKPYQSLVTNQKLSQVYLNNLKDTGVENIIPAGGASGSLDMGDVSQVCPSIHPYFSIMPDDQEAAAHTREFAEATIEEPAYRGMTEAIYALVTTSMDVIKDKDLLAEIKKEYEETFKNR